MLSLCVYCATILCGFGVKKTDMRVTAVVDESPALVCDMMAVFSTTGVDGVHLSAGAEDGNSGQCQVERCPDCLHR